MDARPVIVSTEHEDPTADLVIAELNRRNVPVLRLDPGRDFPHHAVLTTRTGPHGLTGTLTVANRTADLGRIRALYHRRPHAYEPQDDTQGARFAAQENRRGLGGVLAALPGCLYLSHPQAIARAEYKPAQLDAACRLGMLVPPTLITNEPGEAKAFCAEQPAIYKPLHAGNYDVDGEPAGIWAAPVDAGELDDTVTASAHLFQARVDKSSDIRAIVVGDRVLCARITAPPGVVDWRAHYKDLTYESVECPDRIRDALLQFTATFGLAFGAFDFAVTSTGEWWFLECNPNGQWAWLEAATGLPIAAAIADLLQKGATDD